MFNVTSTRTRIIASVHNNIPNINLIVFQQSSGVYDEFTDHVMNLLYYIEGYKSCMNDTLDYLEVCLVKSLRMFNLKYNYPQKRPNTPL